jgi:dephospho-CoA kinase
MPPPARIVVAGGLGSGKSTVAALLAEKGATIIEADRIGHEVLEPGGPAFAAVAQRWPAVVVDGAIDRRRLATIVFADHEQLAELEAITHPAIHTEITRRARDAAESPVVVELPVAGIVGPEWTWIAVIAEPAVRVERAVERGMDEEDVRRRIAAQLSNEEWCERASHVIVNDGSLEALRDEVESVWARIVGG